MKQTREFKDCYPLTTGSKSQPIVSKNLHALPETRGQPVIVLAPVDASHPVVPNDFLDIDQLVEQEETNPEMAVAIMEGRRQVAEAFYSSGPQKLSYYRLSKGWSQKRLAEEAKTSQSYIARIETGEVDPQVSTVKKLAQALEIPVSVLVDALTSVR